jgi:hypothetical protein
MWVKIKAWFKHSLTIAWARIQVVGGILVAGAAALWADPNVQQAVNATIPVKWAALAVIGFGIITEIARRRTAGKSAD